MRCTIDLRLLIIIATLVLSAFAKAEDTEYILMISSYNPDTQNMAKNITEFNEEYKRLGGTHFFEMENMNCKSLPEAPLWKGKMKEILDKHASNGNRKPSMIMIFGQEAWSSYISQDELPFRDVPVLLGMISRNAVYLPSDTLQSLTDWEPTYVDINSYKNLFPLSGFLYSYDVESNLELINSLYPSVRNLALITDNTYGGIALQTFVKNEIKKFPAYNLITLDGRKNDIYSIVEQIKKLPENSAILMGTWRVDMNDGHYVGNATYSMMTANPRMPVFTLTAVGLGHWVIGGNIPDYDTRSMGRDLARQAFDILDAKTVAIEEMNPVIIPNIYTFDAHKLTEFHIDRNLLPKNYTLINKEENIFVRYRFELLALISFTLSVFLVMVIIFFVRMKKMKDSLLDLQKDNELIMNNMNLSLRFIKPDFTVKWQNKISYPFEPEFGPDNCFLAANPRLPYCSNCTVVEAMRTKKPIDSLWKRSDGTYVHILSTPVIDDEGTLLGVVFKKEDVTRQKAVEHELRMAKDKAEESDKLKSAFLANMSHEIRTPLNAIVGFSGLLAVSEDMNERQEYTEIINTNNELLLQLINDILDLSKIEAGTLDFTYGDVDVNKLFSDLEQTLRLKVKPGVRLAFVEKIPDFFINTDKTRLAQVVTNFINNAIKFTDRGQITLGYRHEDGEIYFYVKDTGCGITAEGVKTVFTRFVKLNSFQQGTGLGLSICEMIIRKMGGEIGVESEPGKGSVFWFRLPDSIICSDEDYMDEDDNSTRKLKILIAEDSDTSYVLLSSMLRDYELLHAHNGEEAVKLFRKYRPDIILMDTKMPKMDGYEAVVAIRKENTSIPVIAVASLIFDDDEQIKASGFTDCMTKPVNPEKLLAVIDAYLEYR